MVEVTVRGAAEVSPAGLKEARVHAGWRSTELSEALGESPAFISKLERGRTKSIPQEKVDAIVTKLLGRKDWEGRSEEDIRLCLAGKAGFKETVEFVRFSWTPRRTGAFQRPMIFRWRSLVTALST
jgi:transcriptional regulator with XRE-family HTH domain